MPVIKAIASILSPMLEMSYVKRVRRNHGLEHATIHMLSRYNLTLSGRANASGFVVVGNASTEQVEKAAHEALTRLRNGQAKLALHPNCGTNLVTTGLLMTTIAALGFSGTNNRRMRDRFPIVMLAMMVAAFYSLPIGMAVQEHITTAGDPGDLEIVGVKRREISLPLREDKMVIHRVVTRRG